MTIASDEVRALDQVAERISARFPQEPPDGIRRLVEHAHRQYDGRPIREFVPVLVEREVSDMLRRSGQRTPAAS
jgi:hypothetical protein